MRISKLSGSKENVVSSARHRLGVMAGIHEWLQLFVLDVGHAHKSCCPAHNCCDNYAWYSLVVSLCHLISKMHLML